MPRRVPVVAIEGIDGAGKNTLATALERECARRGLRVGRLAFPRYGHVHADLAADALHGGVPELADSPYAMAALFALDRHAALDDLEALFAAHDVILLDRWVASSAAFTAARLGTDAFASAVEWVRDLEYERLGLPAPDLQVLLATETSVAAARAVSRESREPSRRRDRYERDSGLQARTAEAYAKLADLGWGSPWRVVVGDPDAAGICDEILSLAGGGNRV